MTCFRLGGWRAVAGLVIAAIPLGSTAARAQPAPADPPRPAVRQASAPERRTMTAVRANDSETILVDGILDESVWSRAAPATDFPQQDPLTGEPATERTEVRTSTRAPPFTWACAVSTTNRIGCCGFSAGATSSCSPTTASCG